MAFSEGLAALDALEALEGAEKEGPPRGERAKPLRVRAPAPAARQKGDEGGGSAREGASTAAPEKHQAARADARRSAEEAREKKKQPRAFSSYGPGPGKPRKPRVRSCAPPSEAASFAPRARSPHSHAHAPSEPFWSKCCVLEGARVLMDVRGRKLNSAGVWQERRLVLCAGDSRLFYLKHRSRPGQLLAGAVQLCRGRVRLSVSRDQFHVEPVDASGPRLTFAFCEAAQHWSQVVRQVHDVRCASGVREWGAVALQAEGCIAARRRPWCATSFQVEVVGEWATFHVGLYYGTRLLGRVMSGGAGRYVFDVALWQIPAETQLRVSVVQDDSILSESTPVCSAGGYMFSGCVSLLDASVSVTFMSSPKSVSLAMLPTRLGDEEKGVPLPAEETIVALQNDPAAVPAPLVAQSLWRNRVALYRKRGATVVPLLLRACDYSDPVEAARARVFMRDDAMVTVAIAKELLCPVHADSQVRQLAQNLLLTSGARSPRLSRGLKHLGELSLKVRSGALSGAQLEAQLSKWPSGEGYGAPELFGEKCTGCVRARVLKSNAKPLLLDLSTMHGDTLHVIVKADELELDAFILGAFRAIHEIFLRSKLPLELVTYRVTPAGRFGFIEVVQNAVTLGSLQRRRSGGSLRKNVFLDALEPAQLPRFCSTCLGSIIGGYVFGLRDRHGDNQMIRTDDGAYLQIDFTMCLGHGELFAGGLQKETNPLGVLTTQHAQVLELVHGAEWRQILVDGIMLVRKYAREVLTHCESSAFRDEASPYVRRALLLHVAEDTRARSHLLGLIEASLRNVQTHLVSIAHNTVMKLK